MPDRIVAHYERNAHRLDRARRGSFDERGWFDRMLVALPREAHILDLGCGGGEPIDRYLIDAGHRLTGVDLSEKMIALARTRFARHRWLRTDMRNAMMDRAFDAVVAWDSLYYLNPGEQAELIVRIAGWLEPRGMLLFSSTPPTGTGSDGLDRTDIDPAEYRALFAELGLMEVAFSPHDHMAAGRSVWLLRKDA